MVGAWLSMSVIGPIVVLPVVFLCSGFRSPSSPLHCFSIVFHSDVSLIGQRTPMRIGHVSLRKHAYSNISKIPPPKNWKFSNKNSDIFHISAQNIVYGYSLEPPRRGGSNEYPQSMVLSRNPKNNVYPCKPQFYYIKVGFKGVKIIQVCFRDVNLELH